MSERRKAPKELKRKKKTWSKTDARRSPGFTASVLLLRRPRVRSDRDSTMHVGQRRAEGRLRPKAQRETSDRRNRPPSVVVVARRRLFFSFQLFSLTSARVIISTAALAAGATAMRATAPAAAATGVAACESAEREREKKRVSKKKKSKAEESSDDDRFPAPPVARHLVAESQSHDGYAAARDEKSGSACKGEQAKGSPRWWERWWQIEREEAQSRESERKTRLTAGALAGCALAATAVRRAPATGRATSDDERTDA